MTVFILISMGRSVLHGYGNTIKICFALSLITILFTKATNQHLPSAGKELFESKCVNCHGTDGTKGRWGAKNLSTSRLSDEALFKVISEGRGFMPKWGKKLAPPQIDALIAYIKTLRN
ncbi:MAG: cytochrome c [Ferruginibacter sp.]